MTKEEVELLKPIIREIMSRSDRNNALKDGGFEELHKRMIELLKM